MTTDIEKLFFDTFGIEKIIPCYKCNMQNTNWDCKRTCLYDDKKRKEYPTITDRILLELICLNNRHYVTLEDLICPKNIETIKESVLKKYIERNKEFVDNGYSGFCLKQVQSLFKEDI